MSTVTVFSPAKINLFLAITGRRRDGFHDLVSVVAPVAFGDRVTATMQPADAGGDGSTLSCDVSAVPVDGTNLVLKAARAFRERTGWRSGVHFALEKRVPMGAGLGGGSSNAVAALRALDALAGTKLPEAELMELAMPLGSDCPLFVYEAPVVIRGRGERVERLPVSAAKRLSGRRVLLFKPTFGISTVWAYQQMAAAAPGSYLEAPRAEARLASWLGDDAVPAEGLLFNNMEGPAFKKYLALPALLSQLRAKFGVAVGMSGSGSACVALLGETDAAPPVASCIREAWGADVFIEETRIR